MSESNRRRKDIEAAGVAACAREIGFAAEITQKLVQEISRLPACRNI